MKKIPFNYIEEGQELYFNVERLMQVESALKMPVGKIVKEQDLGVNIMVTLLSIGLRQHGIHEPKWYAGKLQNFINDGFDLQNIQIDIVKALAGSGILGRETYLMFWPEEATEAELRAMEEEREKN
mgnify:FL=1|nr:MAG TPA: tail assembly chaperone [Caudoviricetes sp.]